MQDNSKPVETAKVFTSKDLVIEIILGIILFPVAFIFLFLIFFSVSDTLFSNLYPQVIASVILESVIFYWGIFTLTKYGGKDYAHKSARTFVISGLIVWIPLLILVIYLFTHTRFYFGPGVIF